MLTEMNCDGDEEPGGQPVDLGERFRVTVNDAEILIAESEPDGRQILSESGFRSVEDYVLIQLLCPGTRSVGLDEPVDLRERRGEVFRAFESDRIFRFTIDGRGYEWGSARITEADLRQIACVCEEEILVLVRDGKNTNVTAQDNVDLDSAGTEHLHTAKRFVTVFLNDAETRIPSGTYLTEELISVLGVEAGYLLNVLDEGGKLVLLKPNQRTTVRDRMKFFSQVPCGGSS